MSAVRITLLRWLRIRLDAAAVFVAWQVEQCERDRQHAHEWRAEIERSRNDAVGP